jgi:hypothetical protein
VTRFENQWDDPVESRFAEERFCIFAESFLENCISALIWIFIEIVNISVFFVITLHVACTHCNLNYPKWNQVAPDPSRGVPFEIQNPRAKSTMLTRKITVARATTTIGYIILSGFAV